jgi:hypothetical protein
MLDLLAASADVPKTPPPPAWAMAVTIGFFVAIVTAPLVILNEVGSRRARRLLDEWARANGIALGSADAVAGYQRGPFRMSSRAATVFRITTKENRARTGFVNINNTFVWGCRPEVRWDAAAP